MEIAEYLGYVVWAALFEPVWLVKFELIVTSVFGGSFLIFFLVLDEFLSSLLKEISSNKE